MNLDGLEIINGNDKIKLKGKYSHESLSQLLISNWIPYLECHKCGRHDYCKYAIQIGSNPKRFKVIQCGVATNCLKNIIETIFPLWNKKTKNEIQNYLNSLYYHIQFIYLSEQHIGMCMSIDQLTFFEDRFPLIFNLTNDLKENVDKFSYYLLDLDEVNVTNSILFIEGESEEAFLEELRTLNFGWFKKYLELLNYKGKGNIKNIKMLIDRKKVEGFKIYFSGETDGEENKRINSLIETKHIEKSKSFAFKIDFESSLPYEMTYNVLKNMNLLKDIRIESFVAQCKKVNYSILKLLKENYKIDTCNGFKLPFAKKAAQVLHHTTDKWWKSDYFMKSEFGQFLNFIRKI